MSSDSAQRIIFRAVGPVGLRRTLDGRPNLRWKNEAGVLTLRFDGSSARAVRLETLDRLLALPWEAIDWVGVADVRLVEPENVEVAHEALRAFVLRPRRFTQNLKRSGGGDWYEDEVTEAAVRAEIRACSAGREVTDPEALPLRIVQTLVYLYRSLKRAAKRRRGLAVFDIAYDE